MIWTKANRFKKTLVLIGIGYVVLIPPIYYYAPRLLGMAEAKYDLWGGHYEIRVYGHPSCFDEGYAKRLKDEYGIIQNRAAHCIVNRFVVERVYGYNSVMKKAILETFHEEVVIMHGGALLIK